MAEKKPKSKIYGNRIRAILAETEMCQAELADIALDGNQSYLSRIISNQRMSISLPIAIKIAKGLNRSVEEVFICEEIKD
jgi:DNA-binding XRE family transcriptional regulator